MALPANRAKSAPADRGQHAPSLVETQMSPLMTAGTMAIEIYRDRRRYAFISFWLGVVLAVASVVTAVVTATPAFLAGGFGSGGLFLLHYRHMKAAQELCARPPGCPGDTIA